MSTDQMPDQQPPTQRRKVLRRPSWPKLITRKLPSGNSSFLIDVQVEGNRVYESFKTEAEAVSRAGELHDERQNKGKAAFELTMPQRMQAAEAFKMLTPYPGTKITEAVEYYIVSGRKQTICK